MQSKPKHPLNGLNSKYHFVDKVTWNKVDVEHRSIKRIRGEGGWYENKYVISPEAFEDLSTQPSSNKSAESNKKK